ncbi:AAA family ATPase [Bacillus sp. CGMCC 1.16607]|uniref:AAA family ATPase n=1 Tax=Bacillus sp. CGMCC 1.16607 TaxID=3351842 RepID=UPI00363ACCB5
MEDYSKSIELSIRSGSTIIEVVSYEWQRVHGYVHLISKNLNRDWICWSRVTGLRKWGNNGWDSYQANCANQFDPLDVLEYFSKTDDSIILILEDFHPYMEKSNDIKSQLREIVRTAKNKTIILSQPVKYVPEELAKEIEVIEIELPRKDTILTILEKVVEEQNISNYVLSEKLIESALGLTVMEAERAFTKAAIKNGALTENEIPMIIMEKENIIKKSGQLEYFHPEESLSLSNIGGLDNLKDWIEKRGNAYSKSAREYGLNLPKGVLLLGVPGTGKSLTAKAIAKSWNFPLLRFDLGKVFGGIVGESERNIREALDVAKAISPCVLWIDEIEKGFSGIQSSGSTDGGTTSRVFGTFLTWMQEKKEPVFVIATANDISLLPPELLRKGRFDEIFFVDLPTKEERKNIFEIHIKNKKRNPYHFDLEELAQKSIGFSGAEIEEVINEALFNAFNNGEEIKTEDVLLSIAKICPLSKTMSETISSLRKWAEARARLASSSTYVENLEDKEVPRLKQEIRNPFIL